MHICMRAHLDVRVWVRQLVLTDIAERTPDARRRSSRVSRSSAARLEVAIECRNRRGRAELHDKFFDRVSNSRQVRFKVTRTRLIYRAPRRRALNSAHSKNREVVSQNRGRNNSQRDRAPSFSS